MLKLLALALLIPSQARLGVEMRSTGGPPRDAYVAVVAEDQAFRFPLAEKVLEDTTAVSFLIPSGRYRIVGGAPRFETVYLPVLDVTAGASSAREVTLRPLLPLQGRVVDVEGKPVAGARVGHWTAFLDRSLLDFPLSLSPIGEEHLRANLETTTQTDGSFALPALPGGRHLVWVEAPGFAPGILQDILFSPPEQAGPWEVRLSRGTSLAAHWEPSQAVALEGYRLVLRSGAASRDRLTPLALSMSLWERSLGGSEARWPSLPSGLYEVWLHASRRGLHQEPPFRLAAMSLEAGTAKSLQIRLPPTPLPPAAEASNLPDLRLLIAALIREERDGLEVRRWQEDGPVPQSFTDRTASGGILLELEKACRRGARYQVTGKKRVSAETVVEADPACREPKRQALFEVAEVTGLLKPPAGEALPRTGRLRVARCPRARVELGEPLGNFPFRIETGGRLQAKLPAGCVTASLEVADYAPVAFGPLDLVPGKSKNLGAWTLASGGALLARIVSGADGRSLDGVAVEAVPAADLEATVRAAFKGWPTAGVRHGRTAQGGWVRLYGLPVGDYYLQLRPEGRRWPHFAGPFGVRARDEAFLDGVEVPAPASVEVELRLDGSLAEAASSMRVTAHPATSGTGPLGMVRTPEATEPGSRRFLFSEIPPGKWRLTVTASLGQGGAQAIHEEEVEIPPGVFSTLTLDVREMLFQGRVTYLGQPVEGLLMFKPVPIDGRSGMGLPSSPEGRFQILLPRPGSYEVTVSERSGRLSGAVVPRVDFEDPESEIEIKIPAGRIAGRVVDRDGLPVAGARVEATSFREGEGEVPLLPLTMARKVKADGSFLLEGVAEGDWVLVAKSGGRRSERQSLQLRPEEQVRDIELELEEPAEEHR